EEHVEALRGIEPSDPPQLQLPRLPVMRNRPALVHSVVDCDDATRRKTDDAFTWRADRCPTATWASRSRAVTRFSIRPDRDPGDTSECSVATTRRCGTVAATIITHWAAPRCERWICNTSASRRFRRRRCARIPATSLCPRIGRM